MMMMTFLNESIPNDSNDSNTSQAFDCRLSTLSSENITQRQHWQVEESRRIGVTIVGVLLFLFFLVASVWNLFIIITFFVRHHLLKEPANIILLSMAITDLLICLTTMMFSFVTAFGLEFIFGSNDVTRCAVCSLSGFFFMFVTLVSLHLLAALSVDRFIHLIRPLRYSQIMNRWKAIIICLVLYGLCFLLALLPHLGFGQIEFNTRFASCVPRFTPISNLYYCAVVGIEVLIPIVALAVTNAWMYRLISKLFKKNFRRRSTYRRKDVEKGNTEEGQKHQKQQKQLVKVFSALFITNIISYTPTFLVIFIFLALAFSGNSDLVPGEVFIFGFLSFLTSPVFHPIVESFFVRELRYQVVRAKKGVRRVSTNIYRQTTQMFSNKALDEANRNIDDGDTTPKSKKRAIRFLNGKTVMAERPDVSMVTEMEDLHSSEFSSNSIGSRTASPEPSSGGGGPPDAVIRTSPPSTSAATPATVARPESTSSSEVSASISEEGRPMLGKTRKSVSFQQQEGGPPPAVAVATAASGRSRSESNSSSTSSLRSSPPTSCLRKTPATIVEEEDEDNRSYVITADVINEND